MRKTEFLAALMLLFLLLTGCGQQKAGQDTPYPYTWKETRSGAIVLTIAGEKDSAWVPDGYASDILSVVTERTSTGKTRVNVQPLAAGTTDVVLSRQEQVGGFTSQQFAIRLTVRVDEALNATIADHGEQEYTALDVAAADSPFPCTVKTEQDGSLSLYVSDTQNGSWIAEVDNVVFSVSSPFYDAEGCLYTITAASKGSGTVQLQRRDTGEMIRIPITADENGVITADISAAETFTAETAGSNDPVTSADAAPEETADENQ